jgi:cell division protein FtsW
MIGEGMKKLFGKMDKPLLFLTILYSIIGLIMILSASSVSAVLRYGVSTYYFFIRQLVFVVFSFLFGFLIILRLPTSKYRFFIPFLLIGILAALAGLFVYGIVSNGAQSWYSLGFFNLQPTEFAKSIIIIYMAVFYNKALKKKQKNIYMNLIPIVVGFIMFILIAMQPDFGGAVIIGGIVFLIFMILPIEKNNLTKLLKFIGVAGIIGLVVFLNTGGDLLNSTQLARFQYKQPCSRYQDDTGYQVCNGFIAMHNGGLFGVGLGNSTQKYLYLPEAHTDFIFAIIVEELGLVTGILIIIGYVIILYRILKIAKKSYTLRGSILAYGTFILILLHLLINFLGILALIPLTGVPVPLLSYGGSFTINIITMLFVVQRVAIENNMAKSQEELELK